MQCCESSNSHKHKLHKYRIWWYITSPYAWFNAKLFCRRNSNDRGNILHANCGIIPRNSIVWWKYSSPNAWPNAHFICCSQYEMSAGMDTSTAPYYTWRFLVCANPFLARYKLIYPCKSSHTTCNYNRQTCANVTSRDTISYLCKLQPHDVQNTTSFHKNNLSINFP